MSDTAAVKKRAISAYFSKTKKSAAKQDLDSPADGGAAASGGASPAVALPASLAANADAWVEAPTETAALPRASELASALSTRVTELTDEEFTAASSRGAVSDNLAGDIEAEETRKALWNAIKGGKKAGARKTAAEEAAKPAGGAPATGWRSRTLETKKASGGPVDVKNTVQFPTLERAASGLHPAARFASDAAGGEISTLGKATKWAALAGDDEDEEEDEEEEAAVAAASEAAPAAKPAAAAPAAALPVPTGPVTDVAQLAQGTGAPIEGDDEARSAIDSIIRELRANRDAPATVARIAETPLRPLEARRTALVEAMLHAGLDAEVPAERSAIRKVLSQLAVPGRAVTPAMLSAGVAAVVGSLEDIVVDCPRAEEFLGEMLRGVVVGSMAAPSETPVVPASVLPASLAARMGIHAAPAPAPAAASAADAGVAAVTAGVAAASVAEAAAEPAPAAAAAAADDEDVDAMFAALKKKKAAKKKAAAAAEGGGEE